MTECFLLNISVHFVALALLAGTGVLYSSVKYLGRFSFSYRYRTLHMKIGYPGHGISITGG